MKYYLIYSDGMTSSKLFDNLNLDGGAMDFARKLIDENSNLKEVAIFRNDERFHSTTQMEFLLAWWDNGIGYYSHYADKDIRILTNKELKESR